MENVPNSCATLLLKKHTFGVVHAWFAALLGVTRYLLRDIAKSLTDMAAISRLKFRMSFDVCIQDHKKTVDGIPTLPTPEYGDHDQSTRYAGHQHSP